jgi:site-specific recombinase XerD
MVPTGIVKRRGADIGLPELAPHDLRRTFAQAVWKATHDLIVVQELLGHKDVNTTRRYLCVDQASKIQAVQAIKWGT